MSGCLPVLDEHLRVLDGALGSLRAAAHVVERWGAVAAERLQAGSRVLAAGNGGSAAQAQHLAAELVGRYRDERPGLPAMALTGDTAILTALVNDYGAERLFARQVEACGRGGDTLVLLSTSGRSSNVIAAAQCARSMGITTWALTGPAPNPLAGVCDESLCIDAATTAAVQEAHLVAIHAFCEAVDACLLQAVRA